MMIPTIKKSKVAIFSDLHLGVHSNSSEWHKYAINGLIGFVRNVEIKELKISYFAATGITIDQKYQLIRYRYQLIF